MGYFIVNLQEISVSSIRTIQIRTMVQCILKDTSEYLKQ